jgi:mRNA interferase MazF
MITVALQGDGGKPRPAVVIESDRLASTNSVLICPCTSFLRDDVQPRRVDVEPSARNGLRQPTQVQADKVTFVRREKCGPVFGHLEQEAMQRLNGLLVVLLGLADPES